MASRSERREAILMRVVMISKACVVGIYQRKLEELARLPDVDLTVVVPPFWRDSRGTTHLERSHVEGYRLLVSPMALNGHFHLHFYPGLGRLLDRLNPDLVHMDEEPYNLATWQALRLAAQRPVPACFFSWQNLQRAYPPPFGWFEQYSYSHATHALAGSREAASVLRSKGYSGPVSVVPQFGVDTDMFSPRTVQTRPLGGGLVLGYAGGLVPEKGVDLLLEAAASSVVGDWSLLIAGEGSERERLQSMAVDLGLGERVKFVGRMPSAQMPDFYRSLDALALPSRTMPNWKEQFGRVLVEAMACGVPVLGSDSGEIPHVIGDGGLVFPEGDVGGLRQCLAQLSGDTALRDALSARARERVLTHYTQRQIALATRDVYRAMLERGS